MPKRKDYPRNFSEFYPPHNAYPKPKVEFEEPVTVGIESIEVWTKEEIVAQFESTGADYFEVEANDDGDGYSSPCLVFKKAKQRKNTHYKAQLNRYEVELAKHKEALAKWKANKARWDAETETENKAHRLKQYERLKKEFEKGPMKS